MHVPPRFAIAIVALTLASPSILTNSAAAWNSPGHMTVSIVAYELMDPATRQKALALIHAHPRYDDHFERAMEWELRSASEAEQDVWMFAYASTWPDVVRSANGRVTREDVDKYSRTWWHFVNEPIYLSEAEERKLAPTIKFNRSRELPVDEDDRDMNVIQAIKNSARIVGDDSAPPDLRSVHLCWLMHLTGDSHQPLHSGALVTSRRYPTGDHGGNYLQYSHDFPLHAFWDSMISTEEAYETIRRAAVDLAQNDKLAAGGEEAAKSLDPGVWIDEGHELALEYVYTPEVMKKIAAREGHPHLGALNPAPEYAINAEAVAERQAVAAGHRLAKLLKQLLN